MECVWSRTGVTQVIACKDLHCLYYTAIEEPGYLSQYSDNVAGWKTEELGVTFGRGTTFLKMLGKNLSVTTAVEYNPFIATWWAG